VYLANDIDNIKKENLESDQTWKVVLHENEKRITHKDDKTYTHEELVDLVRSFSKKSVEIDNFLKVSDELTELRSQIRGLVKTKNIVKLYINSFVVPSSDYFEKDNPTLMSNKAESNWLDINHQGGVADALAYLMKKDLIVINGRKNDSNRDFGAIIHEYKYVGSSNCGRIILVLDGVNYMRGEEK
jgi:hypothetical protein